MSTFLLFLFINLLNLFTQALCAPQIPNIFDIKDKSGSKTVGYKILWEITDITGFNSTTYTDIGTSYSVTEYYDIVNRRGRLDIVQGRGVGGTFIYDEITGETFYLNQGRCILGNINSKPDFLKTLVDSFWSRGFKVDRNILGPSVFLRMIYTNQQIVTWRSDFQNSPDKRYFNGNLWNANYGDGIMGWVFTDPSSPNPYGFQNMAIPIWVAVGSYVGQIYKKKKLYEVAQFTPYVNSTRKIISIPLGVGCGRDPNAIKNAPKPPYLKSGFSYDMKLEVVMSPSYRRNGTDVNPTNLVDNGRLTYDDVSKMMAWRYDGFNVTGALTKSYYSEERETLKNAGFYYDEVTVDTGNNNVIIDNGPLKGNELKNPTRTVWDLRAGIVYVIDDLNGGCTIKQKAVNDFLVSINFKAGYKIPINAPELLQNTGFLYMGEFFIRGIPAVAYEGTVNKLVGYGRNTLNKTIVFTHYFVKDNYTNSYIANNMLLRIDISIMSSLRFSNGTVALTKVWSAQINVNQFTIKLQPIDVWSHVKQQVFNVKSCYLRKGLSKWFQLGFPITTKQYLKLFQQADTIDRQLLSYLFTGDDLLIPPTRIPTSMIGWRSNTLYFSALMLERAPFLLDFHVISVGQQKLKKFSRQFLVQSSQDCSGRCLDLDTNCNYFSICSNFMCIIGDPSLDPSQKPEMVKSLNCTTYQKNLKGYSMMTMNRLLSKIQNKTRATPNNPYKIQAKPLSFTLYITNSTGQLETMKLTAVQFKSGFNFGQTNTLDDQITLNNDRYKLKSTTHFKISTQDKRLTLVQATSYLNCQQKCDDFHNNTCHSFSYCTTTQECILSTFHAEEMFDATYNSTYEQKFDCALLYRYYASEYTRIGAGVITPRTAAKRVTADNIEECAFACSNEKSFKCKSFDMCSSGEGPPIQYKCFLHKSHNINNRINESIPLSINPSYVNCGRYSRNYASDFRAQPKVNYANIDGTDRIKVTGLTVEQCAKRCVTMQSKRKCLGFSYCQGKLVNSIKPQPICVLSPVNDQGNTVVTVADEQCEVYFGEVATITKTVSNTQNSQSSSSGHSGYSSGAGAGVGIFMLLLGGFLAVIGMIVYNKRRAALRNA